MKAASSTGSTKASADRVLLTRKITSTMKNSSKRKDEAAGGKYARQSDSL
jgi:hypothetical protein